MRNVCLFTFLPLLLLALGNVLADVVQSEQLVSNPCRTKTKCSECIAESPLCAWCKRENFTNVAGRERCDYYTVLQNSQCNEGGSDDNIMYPSNQWTPIKPKPLSKPGDPLESVVQLYPQEIHMKLRPKNPLKLEMKFRQAEDYPVDLYYLMDLSKSMEDDKDKLASLGSLLAASMGTITRDFRLGFGSFVDKTVMPYVSTVPEKLLEPCTRCAAPYGFRNHMKLSSNHNLFSVEVNNARVSGNLDAPEGGFDAIMQAIVCDLKIGWRSQSRKMVVFSTDSGFHYAGDGKLGGIVTPNDGICHLDDDGVYTESINQDYPSLSQLRHKISEKKVNIIFAVTQGQVDVYRELSKNLEGAYTDVLANDSSNIVQVVKDQYMQITSEVEMKDDAKDGIKVTYHSACLGTKVEETNVCRGLKIGDTITFEVEVEVTSCPADPKNWKQQFHISPVGLNEILTVNLDLLCECDCEKPGQEQRKSPKCNRLGTYECGICDCEQNYYGRFCECDTATAGSEGDDSRCIQPNVTAKICSGRGSCSCGLCHCYTRPDPEERVYGPYCECDNFSCDRHNGRLCSGPSHGVCGCNGVCECLDGWTGNACQCPSSNKTCIGSNGEICSGNGVCDCGVCKCKDKYSGPQCEECPLQTCKGKCVEYRDCVQCQAFGTGELKDNCNCSFKIELRPEVKVENPNERLCVFRDEDDCKFTFVYGYDDKNDPKVRVQETKECPPPVNILMIILAVIGGIVLVGLCLLLIWKLLTTIHDRREFAKFEKERQMAKWDTGENPIYKQATTTFQNPTYGKK